MEVIVLVGLVPVFTQSHDGRAFLGDCLGELVLVIRGYVGDTSDVDEQLDDVLTYCEWALAAMGHRGGGDI